ncbi:hypothetical protein [Flagellimonas sp. CMM7]|uniref:hypothetical protein n=1 Tax=Flagellimonas sp. CMM7 TaxID=2654676 RepID=UPI0013D87D10|nr:hypothetical protein [Flagellimonas sp. CMM7]UII81262.1 hypothetical protein LV704_07025 [Flagellimonas sp. CMM7]
MKYKSLLVIFLMLVFSCSSDSEEPNNPQPNPDPPTQGDPDTTAPTITIGGLESEVEILTTLTVTIADASNTVNTVILVNDTEVFSTTDKTISYELDPFDFPSGATTLTIQSTDDSDNLGTESETFELKKLLFRSTDLAGFDPSNETVDIYVAINLKESGELITSRLMQTYDDATFYAPEEFKREQIVVTRYVLGKGAIFNLNVGESFASLEPGIEIMTVEEAVAKLNLNRGPLTREGKFNLTISDVPVNTDVNANSSDYVLNGSASSGEVFYNPQNTESVLIYSVPSFTDVDLDSYKYFIINQFEDTSLSLNDFETVSVENRITNNLPPETLNYSFQLHGYTNMERYTKDNNHELYNAVGGENYLNKNANDYSFPTISDFSVLRQRFYIDLDDGRKVFASVRGLSGFEVPDLSIDRAGDLITINGTYDTHTLIQDIEGPIPDGNSDSILFRRFYIDDNSNTVPIPFDALEIPKEIILDLTEKGFLINSTNNTGKLSIDLIKREQEVQYQDRIFYFLQRNEAGDTYSVTFPLD